MVKTHAGLLTVQDYLTDRKYGGRSGGAHASHWGEKGYLGTSYAHYLYLGRIFRHVPVGPEDVLVDVGCGTGRVLNFWLNQGFPNRVIGIEIDPGLAGAASRRLSPFPNVSVLCGDAFEILPLDGTIYFLFNPFTRDVMGRFKDYLVDAHEAGKSLTIVYYMTYFADSSDLFTSDGRWEVTRVPEKTFHPAIIARFRPLPRG